MREKFTKDLFRLYELVSQNQKELGTLYKLVEEERYVNDALRIYIDEFLDECDLAHNKENTLALLSRLISLRDEQLKQVLEQQKIPKEEKDTKRALAYLWTKNFHMKRHEKLLEVIETEQLFNPFYRTLLRGFHDVGVTLSFWQFDWNAHIIDTINPQLESRFGDDALKYLSENNLLEVDENGVVTDRAYSVLRPKGEGYEVLAYAQFFAEDVQEIVDKLDILVGKLSILEDEDTNQKIKYIDYLIALKEAFEERDRTKLLTNWKAVDRAWMKITSPIQLGHPLEYYEDHFRKAVALEWDVRLSNPRNIGANKVYDAIVAMYENLFAKIGAGKKSVLVRTEKNLNRVQLYIGRPAFYYASEFNGLFSAQVVPNDEDVSKEAGKKIFAFADNVLDAQRAKPFLKINKIVFGNEFLNQERTLLFKEQALWHEVYKVSTIGHEYGHILWLDSDTEMIMNQSGVFKNIEEFKATTGGLVAFFMNENPKIKKHVFIELIKRAVSLIAWRTSGEVEPYYCEGLIHLKALFDSGALDFDETLHIYRNDKTYKSLKAWYLKHYEKLAAHYLAKKDAKAFLDIFAYKENSYYMPRDIKVRNFVDYYWNLHKSIGREIDETSQKSDWI